LEVEMSDHLDYESTILQAATGDTRNGKSRKKLKGQFPRTGVGDN
jgi:hypothetical protein